MLAYLADCMAIAVKCGIGIFLWFALTMGILAVFAVILAGLKKDIPSPQKKFTEVYNGIKVIKFPKEKKDD